ncbi:MAG: glycoside hydrolase family 3 N-terminal domain-containing protein [Woeseiaceae bacterium]|nr:glycoside hydrolase family 3 N-terminal domain-containing protein [Woeseiaceae bacterium]
MTLVDQKKNLQPLEKRVQELIDGMTLAEKIGQMCQVNIEHNAITDQLSADLQNGRIGSVLNIVDVDVVNEMQRIAVEESRLGIPLLVGRDVIHGFKTVAPIPLGQAATFNPDIVRANARGAAEEAAARGVNWTFAPMIDISRDARWGRIAESFGEDPYLTSEIGIAMVQGFQGDDLAAPGSIAACAKHFVGYGASESGRDYSTANIPENELRNVYMVPFKALTDAGVKTLMTSFSDLDGVPATGNEALLRGVLRGEWGFDGLVVSDYNSVVELTVHGLTENDKEAAWQAVTAGVDMEMASDSYRANLEDLVAEGRIDNVMLDQMVANILRVKLQLGLFDNPYTDPGQYRRPASEAMLETAKDAALQSVVLLQNRGNVLPLAAERLDSIAVIGPLADAPYEQLGTWIFDGDPTLSVTGVEGIRDLVGASVDVRFAPALQTSRSRETDAFDEALQLVADSDAAVLFLGEEAILSGEAHCRADISLPGAQAELVRRVRELGKPVIAVILAGRPLVLSDIVDEVDAILYAWHPGTMGGAAIADLLFGVEAPSGKLPATFPRMVGQIPIYYNQKNTGKPGRAGEITLIDDIEVQAPQTSLGMAACHLDAGVLPLFPFGHGLSYTEFRYGNIKLSGNEISPGDSLTISAEVTNVGEVAADEVVQLYVRDLVANVTRPVRELKGFRRVRIEPGQTITVDFVLHTGDLAFFGRDNRLIVEPGAFHVWIGGSSEADLQEAFRVI